MTNSVSPVVSSALLDAFFQSLDKINLRGHTMRFAKSKQIGEKRYAITRVNQPQVFYGV